MGGTARKGNDSFIRWIVLSQCLNTKSYSAKQILKVFEKECKYFTESEEQT